MAGEIVATAQGNVVLALDGMIVNNSGGGQANPAIGTILPDGRYSLKTSRTAGLTAGKYRVAVSVYEPSNTPPGERATELFKLLTPEKYYSVETSGLEFEVEPGRNTIDIGLSSSDSGGQAR